MSDPVFYRGGGFEVTDRLLRTPRKTYSLGQIEYVSVQRPLLFFAGLPALGLIGFAFAFWRYLLPGEAVMLIGFSAASIGISLAFGTLHVHSLALRDDDVSRSFGPIHRLRGVRRAVEDAMTARTSRVDAP